MSEDEGLLIRGRKRQVKKEILVDHNFSSSHESESASLAVSKKSYLRDRLFIFEPNEETLDLGRKPP